MRLSDRDRKILWTCAHDSCAVCRSALVYRTEQTDRYTVIGEEAHVVSAQPGGPRGQDTPPPGGLHGHENRILLCPTCHAIVDDQPGLWPTPRLLHVRRTHEAWARERLHRSDRIRLVAHPGEPAAGRDLLLGRVTTGREVWDIAASAAAFHLSGLDDNSGHPQSLVDTGDGFLQLTRDYGDIADDVADGGAGAVRDAQRSLGAELRTLEESGLLCFGSRRLRLLLGGMSADLDWPEAHLAVVRLGDPEILRGSVEQGVWQHGAAGAAGSSYTCSTQGA